MLMPNRILKFAVFLLASNVILFSVKSQRTTSVSGEYTYVLSDTDNVTIREAKIKAIEQAQAEALKAEFGTMVASDFITSDRMIGDEFSSIYLMDTSSSARGEWLGDERPAEVTVNTNGENIFFTAKVWGTAREIIRATPDIKWQVMKDDNGRKYETDNFLSGDRIFVNFSSPADGYVAVYLITGEDETYCLLPYPKDSTGRYKIKGGREMTFFDKVIDANAKFYKLTTDKLQEYNQLVVVYSPNPFTKCTDTSAIPGKPNVLNQRDFAKWLLKQQRADKEMVVCRKWVQITSGEKEII